MRMRRLLDLRHTDGWHSVSAGVATSLFPSEGWVVMIVSEWDDRDRLIALSEVRLIPETCLTDAMLVSTAERSGFLH